MPRSSKCSLSFRFPHKTLHTSPPPLRGTCRAHKSAWFYDRIVLDSSPNILSTFTKYLAIAPYIRSGPCSKNMGTPGIRSMFTKYLFPRYPVHVHKISVPQVSGACSQNIGSLGIRSMLTKYRFPRYTVHVLKVPDSPAICVLCIVPPPHTITPVTVHTT